MKKSNIEKTEQLAPEIDNQKDGAKKALQYFSWLLDAQKATTAIIEDQKNYAAEQLKALEHEKARKFETLGMQSSD